MGTDCFLKYGGINIQKPLGIHHIRTILFSLAVIYLKDLRDFGLDKGGVDPFSTKYRLSSIIGYLAMLLCS
jgi:hypothetical protein